MNRSSARKRRARKSNPGQASATRVQPRSYPVARSYNYSGRYFDNGIFLDPGISSPAWQIWNLLSLFDPDTTGTGHQPIGFDQLMTMYDHYTVYRAEVRVTFASQDATYPQLAVCYLADKSGTGSNAGTVIENGRSYYEVLGPRAGGQQVVTIKMDVDMSTFFARDVLEGDKYMGTSTGSPTEGVYLHVGLQGPASINTAGCYIWTEIVYHARLSEPALVPES